CVLIGQRCDNDRGPRCCSGQGNCVPLPFLGGVCAV
nr:Chain A, Ep-AMP1 [synthetic construct]